jgi:DNA-binding beta-propeller fold protein YncE
MGPWVQVVDLDTEKVVGEIKDTDGVHGIAIAPDLGKGFISAGRDNKVVIFDLKTHWLRPAPHRTEVIPTGSCMSR